MSQEPQINGSNCLEQIHAAGTVPEAVMRFQGNPPVIPVKTYKIAVVGFKRHRHAEIADIGFYKMCIRDNRRTGCEREWTNTVRSAKSWR